MKIFNYEINFSLYNEWSSLNILWNKDVNYNWYDATLLQFQANYINFKNIKPRNIKFVKNDLNELEDLFNSVVRPLYSYEITLGLVGFVVTITMEKFS
jgi:hypothetical protein